MGRVNRDDLEVSSVFMSMCSTFELCCACVTRTVLEKQKSYLNIILDGCCVREIGLLSLVYYHMALFNERLTHVRKNEINAKYMNSE